ncbi:MAG: S26 family signal peptidase, partial [Clostridiales bacterium]|nr:S26 family signal peptidase [Clostridiales bacterium]
MHKENGQYDPRQAVFDDGRIREENPYDENGQTPYIMQRLLKLAEEAEQQASRAAETANTAGILAQGLIAAMQADFDAEKAAQADKEYSEATEAKGTALAGLDILESAKRDYELYQLQLLRAKNNLEIAQQQANRARQEYLQLQKQAEESNTPPLPQAPPISKAPDMPLFVPPEREPGYMAAANGSLTRNRVSGIALANPLPAPVLEPPLAPSRFGPPEQATLGQETAIPAKTREQKENSLWQYAKTMAVTLVVVVCLRLFVFDVVQVNGGSMIPT